MVNSQNRDTGRRMPDPETLPRRLGLWSAIAVLVGTTIGSGIFRVPSTVAADVGSLGAMALIWLLGALVALFGALTLAELAAMFPRSGGIYVFLREAYGPLPAFLAYARQRARASDQARRATAPDTAGASGRSTDRMNRV